MIPLAAVLVSLLAIAGIATARTPNIREAWTFGAALLKFLLVLSLLPAVLAGQEPFCHVASFAPGLSLAFKVDAMGMLFALVSSSLWILTSCYSIGYMRTENEHAQTRYYCCFAMALCATIGVAFAANLFTLYLFYELLSFATWPLVTHHQDAEARRSGRKYLGYIVGGSIALALPAMVAIFGISGTLEFTPTGILSDAVLRPGHMAAQAGGTGVALTAGMTTVLLLAFVFGFAKAGVMPLHSWLPAAMVAPTPVSALLHAVAVVKVGAFSVFRVITHVFGVDILSAFDLGNLVAIIASVTIIAASLIALSQDGLKRRLAFSTIGQLSYILLGAALLSPKSLTGGLMHIALHAFGKITLFMCAGAIFVATGKSKISEMDGLGRAMPVTMGAFFLGALSIIGLPPCGGFISKWYILQGALDTDQISFMVVLLGSSLLNAAYFLPIIYRAFFKEPTAPIHFHDEFLPYQGFCVTPPTITAVVSVLLLIYPQPFLQLAQMAAAQITGM
ncbi:monovalent cation/H+ antiporter subunit D family protein [Megalodesulfovibrio paquesii]